MTEQAYNLLKSESLANMSHQLRTPLNVILGMGELLGEGPLTPEQRRQVEILRKAGEVLLGLIEDILDLSRLEAGVLELEEADFDPVDVAGKVTDFMALRARQKGLALHWRPAPGIPRRLRGSPSRLKQVLIYLLGDAIRIAREGEITLALAPVPDGERTLRFSISTQAGASPAEARGEGLGLAISGKLVALMGGTLSTRSPGAFTFTARFGIPRAAPPPPAPPAEGARPLRILLAEDAEDNRLLVQGFLANASCEIDMAEDGEAAVRKFSGRAYDLVLMDIQMPVMNGYEATREIRRIEQARGKRPVPILALTAHALQEDARRSLEAGCDAHLAKPIRKAALLEAIRRHTAGRGA